MHIQKNNTNSSLRMTKDREMNLYLQVLPIYYHMALSLTKDRSYWDDPKNQAKWVPFFGAAKIDEMKEKATLHLLLKPETMLQIFAEVGILQKDDPTEAARVIEVFQEWLKSDKRAHIVSQMDKATRALLLNPKDYGKLN